MQLAMYPKVGMQVGINALEHHTKSNDIAATASCCSNLKMLQICLKLDTYSHSFSMQFAMYPKVGMPAAFIVLKRHTKFHTIAATESCCSNFIMLQICLKKKQ